MKTLSLTNRRILVGFLLVGLMIIKSTLLEKTKEGFDTEDKCVLDSTGDPCSFKNYHNYSEKYKYSKYYVEKGFKKDVKKTLKSDKFFLKKIWILIKKYFKYLGENINLMTSMFSQIKRYNLKWLYACEKNKKKCENKAEFLNYSIVKMFINKFNGFIGITPRPDLFEKCKDEGSYKYIDCCAHKTVWYRFYKNWFLGFVGLIFLIFLFIFLYIFFKKL